MGPKAQKYPNRSFSTFWKIFRFLPWAEILVFLVRDYYRKAVYTLLPPFGVSLGFLGFWISARRKEGMDRYQKVEKPKPESPVNENEIRITSQGLVRNYISYATTLLQVLWFLFVKLMFRIFFVFSLFASLCVDALDTASFCVCAWLCVTPASGVWFFALSSFFFASLFSVMDYIVLVFIRSFFFSFIYILLWYWFCISCFLYVGYFGFLILLFIFGFLICIISWGMRFIISAS